MKPLNRGAKEAVIMFVGDMDNIYELMAATPDKAANHLPAMDIAITRVSKALAPFLTTEIGKYAPQTKTDNNCSDRKPDVRSLKRPKKGVAKVAGADGSKTSKRADCSRCSKRRRPAGEKLVQAKRHK